MLAMLEARRGPPAALDPWSEKLSIISAMPSVMPAPEPTRSFFLPMLSTLVAEKAVTMTCVRATANETRFAMLAMPALERICPEKKITVLMPHSCWRRIIPAAKISDRWTLVGMLSSSYRHRERSDDLRLLLGESTNSSSSSETDSSSCIPNFPAYAFARFENPFLSSHPGLSGRKSNDSPANMREHIDPTRAISLHPTASPSE
mmetsp:Transcript_27595/g.89891  ORF Transcript_27595/g.89891 Transcript_27595/m.89891 type:complete len:204 (-) Transcript_27595:1327-1938(-)